MSIPVTVGESRDSADSRRVITHYRYERRPVCRRCVRRGAELARVGNAIILCAAGVLLSFCLCAGLLGVSDRPAPERNQPANPAKTRTADPHKPGTRTPGEKSR